MNVSRHGHIGSGVRCVGMLVPHWSSWALGSVRHEESSAIKVAFCSVRGDGEAASRHVGTLLVLDTQLGDLAVLHADDTSKEWRAVLMAQGGCGE